MNGVFAVEKPSGVSSLAFILQIQRIFDQSKAFAPDLEEARNKVKADLSRDKKWLAARIEKRAAKTKIKMGHGGTLDPLARGVLVIGVGTGTKKLGGYLGECTKTYETWGMLGQATTTGDYEGELIARCSVDGITEDDVKRVAAKFVGSIRQTPPIFSALKVDGLPLYEYARKGLPLPKAIKVREVKVHSLEVHGFGTDSLFKPRLSEISNGEALETLLSTNKTLIDLELFYSDEFMADPKISDSEKVTKITPKMVTPEETPELLPVFHATALVSSGTYIRSLVSDIGRALGSAAFMAQLVRTQQGEWEMGKNVFKIEDFEDESVWAPVLREVLEKEGKVDLAQLLEAEAAKALEKIDNLEEKTDREVEGDGHAAKKQKTE